MEQNNLKILLFDIGGVMLSNGWGNESRKLACEKFGLSYEEVNELHNFIFNVYEIGSITLDEYLDRVVFTQSRDFTKEDFKAFIYSRSVELPTLQWLKEWKRGCGFRVISVNNEGKELNDYRVKKFKLHEFFDAFVSSCEVRMRKPDPGIWQLAMGIAQASPDQCVYFDDRIMFVHAAQRLGIRAFQHTDLESTKKILQQLKEENNNK
nr:HAD-IA family hydrolase [uncultured Mucilaginibacter sp.]